MYLTFISNDFLNWYEVYKSQGAPPGSVGHPDTTGGSRRGAQLLMTEELASSV